MKYENIDVYLMSHGIRLIYTEEICAGEIEITSEPGRESERTQRVQFSRSFDEPPRAMEASEWHTVKNHVDALLRQIERLANIADGANYHGAESMKEHEEIARETIKECDIVE